METLASDPEAYKKFLEEIDTMAREERFKTLGPLPSLPALPHPKNSKIETHTHNRKERNMRYSV
jgi:hypothetical protein